MSAKGSKLSVKQRKNISLGILNSPKKINISISNKRREQKDETKLKRSLAMKKIYDKKGRKGKKTKEIKIKYDYTCQICGIKDELKGFLDIDHQDGNHQNNNEENLWLLCPNCHRYKTIYLDKK